MNLVSPITTDCSKSDYRRQQIRLAAAHCFKKHGFHGASMLEISKLSGMSVGHIYHFYQNKDAIIADIVNQDKERILALIARLKQAQDREAELIIQVEECINDSMNNDESILKLEIMAEASRNSLVAQMVQTADATLRQSLIEVISLMRQTNGYQDQPDDLNAKIDVLVSLFEGLRIRAFKNTYINADALKKHVIHTVRQLILGK
jgi:TetR/AcrR family transcriptional repressor of uid operon